MGKAFLLEKVGFELRPEGSWESLVEREGIPEQPVKMHGGER